jgi:hypothetical protein
MRVERREQRAQRRTLMAEAKSSDGHVRAAEC